MLGDQHGKIVDELDVQHIAEHLRRDDNLTPTATTAQDGFHDRGSAPDKQSGVAPTNAMPVRRRVSLRVANETLPAPIFMLSRLLTSTCVVFRTTQATNLCSLILVVTKMQFAQTSIA